MVPAARSPAGAPELKEAASAGGSSDNPANQVARGGALKCAKEKNRCGLCKSEYTCTGGALFAAGGNTLLLTYTLICAWADVKTLCSALCIGRRLTSKHRLCLLCRAAQRRFRERQKCLITDLKSRAESLQKESELQRHRIAELEKENSVRRARAERGGSCLQASSCRALFGSALVRLHKLVLHVVG
jgi:hypothetical protein